jgi:shikimate kinase
MATPPVPLQTTQSMLNKPFLTSQRIARIQRIQARLDRPVVLIGLMGVGKSSVGKRLARKLNIPFIDADDAIEEAAGCSIAEIFKRYGEAEFRAGEQRVIKRLLEAGPHILATGGGAVVDPQTRSRILEKGLAVWLHADIDILVERTAKRDTRPLLKNGDPYQTLSQLLEARNAYYAQAPLHVQSARGPHETTVDAILAALDAYFYPTNAAPIR